MGQGGAPEELLVRQKLPTWLRSEGKGKNTDSNPATGSSSEFQKRKKLQFGESRGGASESAKPDDTGPGVPR